VRHSPAAYSSTATTLPFCACLSSRSSSLPHTTAQPAAQRILPLRYLPFSVHNGTPITRVPLPGSRPRLLPTFKTGYRQVFSI